MEENNTLLEVGSLGNQGVEEAKPVEAVNTDSLLRITPTELTSPYAGEAEKINYRRASEEYSQGIESAPDYLDVDGTVRSIGEGKPMGSLIEPYLKSQEQISDDIISYEDVVEMGAVSGLAEEEMEYLASKNTPAIKREREIRTNYAAYEAGRLTYEEFLIKTYGNDVLKAQGYHTDSIAWWKSEFRKGNYQHPLDNEFLKAGVVQQAESLFALESFYNTMLGPSKNLESLVGKTLEGDDYKKVFGESWDKVVESLGDYERAVTYFKGGYLGDMLNQLVYEQYDNAGNPVGDPKYYMASNGKLYELVDRNTTDKIDKSRQMFLYKNADGSVDRVSTAKGWAQELGGSFVNGMAGAFLGIVDLVAMIGMEWATAFQEDNVWDGASKLFLPLVNKLWNKDDKAFTDAYAGYNATMNQARSFALQVQSFDNDKWDADNVVRAVGSGVGFVVETGIEIAISVATAGAGGAAIAAAKGAKAAGTSAVKAGLKGLSTQITGNLSRLVAKKTVGEGVEVLIKKGADEVAQKAVQEGVEAGVNKVVGEIVENLGEAGMRELLEAAGGSALDLSTKEAVETNGRLLIKNMVQESMDSVIKEAGDAGADMVVNIAAKEVQEGIVGAVTKKATEVKVVNSSVKSLGRFVKEGTKWSVNKGLRLSNTLRMLNSGATPLGTKAWTKMLGGGKFAKKWATSFSRGTLGAVITIGETAANQRVLQQVRPDLKDETLIANSLWAGFITLGSTLLLSSSTDDMDNIERLTKDLSPERTKLLAYKNMLGDKYNKETVEKLTQAYAKEQADLAKKVLAEFDKFDIGKYINKQSSLRIVGGFSELLDNVLTSSARTAANMGVESIWGTMFSMDGILNPEVIVPAVLSSGISVVGRKGLFGKGDNEGSFNKGAAAAKATVQNMFTDLMSVLDILARNAAGTDDEVNIINLKTQLQQDYATAWKNNNANTALAALDVLENLSKGLGADAANPLTAIDDLVKRLSTTDAFKTALKNKEFAGIDGFTDSKGTKLNSKFSFANYIGKWYDKDYAKSVYAYERAVINEYETRVRIRNEAMALTGTNSGNKILNHLKTIGKNFLKPLKAMEKTSVGISDKLDQNNRMSQAMVRLFTDLAGDDALNALSIESGKINIQEYRQHLNTFNYIAGGMNELISYNEMKLLNNIAYTKMEATYGSRVKTSDINDMMIAEKEFIHKLSERLIADKYAKDLAEAAILISYAMKNSKVDVNKESLEVQKAFDYINEAVKIQNKANEAFAIDYGLTKEELKIIIANARSKDEAKKHIENGLVVTFATRDEVNNGNAAALDSEERDYIETVKKGVSLLNKFNQTDGSGVALDFIVLNDGNDGGPVKIYIASPVKMDNIISIIKGPERLKKIVLLGGLMSNPKVSAENLREYTEALFSIIKPTDKVFSSVKDIIEYGLKKDDPADYNGFLNQLVTENLITKENLAKIIFNMTFSDEDFHANVLKEMRATGQTPTLTGKIVKVMDGITTVRKILDSVKDETKLPPNTASQLASAAKAIQEGVYGKDGKPGEDYLIEMFGIKDTDDFKFKDIIEKLAKTNSSNFPLTQSELAQAQKVFSIQSTVYSENSADNKQKLIKKMRQLKKLGLDAKFDEAIKNLEERFDKDTARIGTIENLLRDPVEFAKFIRSEEALKKFNTELSKLFVEVGLPFELSGNGILDFKFIKASKLFDMVKKEYTALNKIKTEDLTEEQKILLKATGDILKDNYDIEKEKVTFLSISDVLKKYEAYPGAEKLLNTEEVIDELKRSIFGKKLLKAQTNFKDYMNYYLESSLGDYYDTIKNNKDIQAAIEKISKSKAKDKSTIQGKITALKDYIKQEYDNAVIYSKTEQAIYNAFESRDKLYRAKGVVAFLPNINKVTINIGEVVTKAYGDFEKELFMRDISNDSEYTLDDVMSMARGNSDIVNTIKKLTALYHRFQNNPILQFDLSSETEKQDFMNLLTTLGYSSEDFNEAAEGRVLKIPGMYFNNDNAAIQTGNGKFKSLGDLIKKEMNALVVNTISSTQSEMLRDRVLIRSMFPEGIIDINESTPLRSGDMNVGFNMLSDMTVDNLFELMVGYHNLSFGNEHKSGKLARGSASFYTQQIATLTANGKEPVEFQNYMLLRSIAEGLVDAKLADTKNENAKIFPIPEGANIEALKSFGWIINDDAKYISGFNIATNKEFFKNNASGEVNLYEVLPINKFGDNDFKRTTGKEGGPSAPTFESKFYNELIGIFGNDNETEARTTNGVLKVIPNVVEGDLEIDEKIKTFGDAIAEYSKPEYKNNLTAISFVFALKSAMKASEAYTLYLKQTYTDDEVVRLKRIGLLVDNPEVLKELVNDRGLSNEEILKSVKNKVEEIRERVKRRADIEAAQSKPATVKAKDENIHIGQSVTYDSSYRLPSPELIELGDIDLLRKYVTQAFLNDGQELFTEAKIDYKNRFLSLLSEDDKGNIALPVANISKISMEDLGQDIVHNNRKLKLGGYIKETFGNDFYDNLVKGIELYNGTFLVNRSLKFKTTEYSVSRPRPDAPRVGFKNHEGGFNKKLVSQAGENAIINNNELARRRIADDEILNASVLTGKDKTDLEPLVQYAMNNIDNGTIQPFQTLASTRVANLNNPVIASNQLENIISIKDMLLQGELKMENQPIGIKFTNNEEAAEELATQIVTLSNTSLNKAKTSFIVVETDENGENPKTTLVLSDEEDPYTRLISTLAFKGQDEKKSKYYLLSVETGFALKRAGIAGINEKDGYQGNAAFKLVDITGFNKFTTPEETTFGRKLLLTMLMESTNKANELKDDMSIDEYNKIVAKELQNYRLDQEAEFVKQMITERFKDKSDVIQPMLSLFKNKLSEVSATSSRKGFREQMFYNTIGANNSILKQKDTNTSVLRRQGVIFDNLDRESKDVILEELISKAHTDVQANFMLKSKEHKEKVFSIVEDLLEGRTPKINSLNLKNNDADRDVFIDVIRLFATRTDNTAFKKYVLQSINNKNIYDDNQINLTKLSEKRSSSDLAKNDIDSLANNKQGFKLEDVNKASTVKFAFDGEWIFTNKTLSKEKAKRLHWQLGYSFVDENGKTNRINLNVKLPDDVYSEIMKAIESSTVPSDYREFVDFLRKTKTLDTFKASQKNGMSPEEAMKRMKSDIIRALKNKNAEALVFMSHNGKGTDSDIETMRLSFGDAFKSLDEIINGGGTQLVAGKTILGHVDLYNDVLNKTFLDADTIESEDNKRNLQALGRKYISKDYEEKHSSAADASDLLEIFNEVYKTGNVRETASTKVLDYVNEIYKLVGGTSDQIPSDLFNRMDINLKFNVELSEEENNHLKKWAENTEIITEEMQKAVFDGLDYMQKRIDLVQARVEMEDAVKKLTPYDYDKLKKFFDQLPKNAGSKIKNAFEKIYTITNKMNLYGDEINQRFTYSLTQALSKVHPSHNEMIDSKNKMAESYYSDDTFIAFAKSVVDGGDEYIDQIVGEMIKATGKKFAPEDIIKSDSITENNTGLKNIIDDGAMDDLIPNAVASRTQKKVSKLINNLILDDLSDTTGGDYKLVSSLGEQLLTIYGAEENVDVDQLDSFRKAASTIYLNNSSLVSELKKLQSNGFADVLSVKGLYKTATAINVGMKERLGLDTTTGVIVTNDAGVEQLLGMTLQEYKTLHNIEDNKNVFINIFRQPGDRTNPIHAYKLLVDNDEQNGKKSFFAISAHEIVSKHSGDFDGDKINIIVPDVSMQHAYNVSGYLNYINKPYVAMEKFIDSLYKDVGNDYIRKDTMRFLSMQKIVADILKSNPKYYAEKIFKGIMNTDIALNPTIKDLLDNEETYKNLINTVKAQAKKYKIDLSDDDAAIDKEIFDSIAVKESRGYLLHNRNIVNADGEVFKGFLEFLNKNAINEFPTKIFFASELRYRDSVTGEAQKSLLRFNTDSKSDSYITLKFDGDIYKLIAEANKDETKKANVIKSMKNSGIDEEIIKTFIQLDDSGKPIGDLSGQSILNIFALTESVNYKNANYEITRKNFGRILNDWNKKNNIDLQGQDPLEVQVKRIVEGSELYNRLMPSDFSPAFFTKGKRLSNEEALVILDMARNSERYRRSHDTKDVLTYQEAQDLGLTKEVSVLVDLDKTNPIAESTAKLTNKKNYIYVSEGRNIYDDNFKSKYEGTYEKVTKKPLIHDMYAVDVYRQPFDNNLKLTTLNAGTFGKVELTGGVETGKNFEPYDYIIGLSTFKKANEAFDPDTFKVEWKTGSKHKGLKLITIDGKDYMEIKMKVGINENVAGWPQEVKDISIDPLTMMHSFGTVESLPLFGGAFAKINEKGEIEWDATKIAKVEEERVKARKSSFRPNNFLSSYNQLRAIKILKFGLENIPNTPENASFIAKMKEAQVLYKQADKNFGSELNFAFVTDLIKTVNDKTNGGFLKYLDTKASEVNKRLFSKTLWDMAFFNSTTIYDFDNVKQKYQSEYDRFKGHVFYSKGGAAGIANKYFDTAQVPTHITGDAVDTFSGDTSYSKLYMNQLDALNYLISDAKPGERSSEYISQKDVLSLIRAGFSGLAKFDETSMAEGYLPKTSVEGNKKGANLDEIKAADRDVKSGLSGESGQKQNALLTTWGVLPSATKGYHYFPGSVQTDDKGNFIYNFRKLMDKFKIDSNGKILVSDKESSVNANVTVPRFLKQITTLLNDEFNTNDKILRFKSLEPDSVVAHINPTFLDMEDGVITPKYFKDQGVKAKSFGQVEEILKNKYSTTMSGQSYGEKERIAENAKIVNEGEVSQLQSMRKASEVSVENSELIELKNKLSKSNLEEDNAADYLVSANSEDRILLAKARERRNYFKGVYEGNIEDVNFKRDLLDTEGMAVKGVTDIYMKQGIQNFYINSKRYQMELTDGLEMIKQTIGDDTYKLDEFSKFTQARLIQLAYQEAKLKSNEYSLNRAKDKIREMGFINIDDVESFLTQYNKGNKGLVNLYFKTIDTLKEAALEVAEITGSKETPDELFLLSPLQKKVDTNNTNKLKYYSTLDTVFLDKRANLESIIEQATDLNFGLSVWYLSGNLGKIKAVRDAQQMFIKSGAIENKTIYDVANKDFGQRLRSLGEAENKMSASEKEVLIDKLNSDHPELSLSNDLVKSPTFLAEVYDKIEDYISRHKGEPSLKKMTLFELDERLKVSKDQNEKDNIVALINAKKMQRDFMSDVITLVPTMAKNMFQEIQTIAQRKGAVLTNEFMQMLPEDGKSSFSFLGGYDLKTIKRNVDYHFSGNSKEERIAYMALTGNLFLTESKLANHLDKYYFTEKVPTNVEKILSQAKGTFTNLVMSMPHKLINRMTQYSIGDLSLISVVDPTVITKVPGAISELGSFYNSKGASLDRSPKLRLFLDTIGFDPTSYKHGSLNFETMDYDSNAKLGQAYFDAVEKVFTAQTLTFRYALWSSLYDRFEAYNENPSKDKRLYGSLDYIRDEIDAMENSAVKAREITNAAIGGPNGFALIARKELKNWGMFMTYPLALMRAGVGHLKSVANVFDDVLSGTANNATKRYVLSTGMGIAATQVMISAVAALIASIYGVDKETEEEWKKKGTYIDPFLTLINDRPIPLSLGSTGLTKQLREMFYEPFEEAEGNIGKGVTNWLTANVLGKLNPLAKIPLELFTGKEFYGNAGPTDTASRDLQENLSRKILSMFIGQSGAIAMTDQWYYSRVGQDDRHFVSKLAESFKEAIKGEMGNYRGYKQESKNYFKALSMLRGFKDIENMGNKFTMYNDNGFNLEQMSGLSKEIKTAMDKEQPPSVIYGIIDDYIKEGASSSTIRAAIFNNSISGKISQLKNFDQFYAALSPKERTILDDAIKYEETNYSIIKTMVADYIDGSKNNYKKSLYVPRNYYSYPSYNKYNNYNQYYRSWFQDDRWKSYAKDYMEYRAKQNFVPSLTPHTGKYAKDFYDYGIPKIKRVYGNIKTARYEEDDNNQGNHRVNKKGR